MIQRIIDIKTDGISAFDKETRQLVICLASYGITVALSDKYSGYWISVEVLQFTEEDMKDIEDLMQKLKQQSVLLNYTEIDAKIFICTPDVMVIPAPLQKDAEQFLQLQFSFKQIDLVITEPVNTEIVAALKINSHWIGLFTGLFPKATLHSTLGWLIKQSLNDCNENRSPMIQIVFYNGLVELVVVKNGQLLIAKCFHFQAIEDINYQLLNICKHLYINSSEAIVKVQGLIQSGSPLYESLLKYFSDVQLNNANTNDWGVLFKTIPAHYFTGLINASS